MIKYRHGNINHFVRIRVNNNYLLVKTSGEPLLLLPLLLSPWPLIASYNGTGRAIILTLYRDGQKKRGLEPELQQWCYWYWWWGYWDAGSLPGCQSSHNTTHYTSSTTLQHLLPSPPTTTPSPITPSNISHTHPSHATFSHANMTCAKGISSQGYILAKVYPPGHILIKVYPEGISWQKYTSPRVYASKGIFKQGFIPVRVYPA